MNQLPHLLLKLASLLAVFVFSSVASCQELHFDSASSQFADETLQEAETLARALPKNSQISALARIAVEFGRVGNNASARRLWSELDELTKQSADKEYRESALTIMARERTRSGDLDQAKNLVDQVTPPAQHKAIQAVVRMLCEQEKFKEAVVYAEAIPRGSSVLFQTMEEVGLAAAEGGETKCALRASRGMNPGQGGSLAQKMRIACRMCNFFWRNGHVKPAISFMREAKKLVTIGQLDLETRLVIDATLAALQSDDFEADLKEILARLNGEPIGEVHKLVIQIGIAAVALKFKHRELLKHFKGDLKEYRWAMEAISTMDIENYGNAEQVKSLETYHNPIPFMRGLVRLAQASVNDNQPTAALEHVGRAVTIAQEFFEQDELPESFYKVFTKLLSAQSAAGQHAEALTLAKQYPVPTKVPELMAEVVAASRAIP